MRERFIPRIMEARADTLRRRRAADNLDPHKVWDTMFKNEKPGGHGERSVAIGTIDMAVWDAVAKIEAKPLFQLLAERYGNGTPNTQGLRLCGRRLLLPGPGPRQAQGRDAQLHRPAATRCVKKKIGGDSLDEDLRRIDSILSVLQDGQKLCVDANGPLRPRHARSSMPRRSRNTTSFWYEEAGRSARLRAAGHAAQLLRQADGDRREPVLDAGRAQPDPLWRHAPRPRLAAVRLRAQLRPGANTSAHLDMLEAARVVALAAASRTAAIKCR